MTKTLARVAAVMAAFAATVAVGTAACASTLPATRKTLPAATHKLWLIGRIDLATIGGKASDYTWVTCGGTHAAPCANGQIMSYESYFRLDKDLKAGKLARGNWVLFDSETWPATPDREQDNPGLFLKLAAQAAHKYGVHVIESPFGPDMIGQDAAAAQYADAVDVQVQGKDGRPAAYAAAITRAVTAMRAVSKTVIILGGLAPDPGGRLVTAGQMYRSYKAVYSEVQGYWLNANKWIGPRFRGCNPQGCPAVVHQFLKDVTRR